MSRLGWVRLVWNSASAFGSLIADSCFSVWAFSASSLRDISSCRVARRSALASRMPEKRTALSNCD
ncbi:hypothetical protein D3C78_1415230 [compost metagenome]